MGEEGSSPHLDADVIHLGDVYVKPSGGGKGPSSKASGKEEKTKKSRKDRGESWHVLPLEVNYAPFGSFDSLGASSLCE